MGGLSSPTRLYGRSRPPSLSALARCLCAPAIKRQPRSYERLGFSPSPTDPLHLMVHIKDLSRTFGDV
jgi:hypothetical protein